MKKFNLFDDDYYKLINQRRDIDEVDKIKISSDNEKRVKKSLKKQAKRKRTKNKSNFYNQFDTLMYTHSDEEPSCHNSGNSFNLTRDLDFQNNYSRFAMKNMHYGVTNREDFTHNNMLPNTSRRDFEVNDGVYQDRKLQIHSGIDKNYHIKKEVETMFEPTKNQTFVHGAPVMTDVMQTRYIPDEQKNFTDLPFENKVKVIPGINGMNQEGRNSVYRIMPKSVDELRAKNDQKVTYKAKKVHAIKKGELRAADPHLTKHKLPDHKEVKVEDLVPNKATVNRAKVTGKIAKASGHRSTVNNYVGPSKNSTKGDAPSINKSKWKKSSKTTYNNDNQRNISNVVEKKQMQNKKSFKPSDTNRVTTNYEEQGNANNTNMGSYAHNPDDIPLTTLREMMIHNDNIIGVTKTQGHTEYAFSKDMVLPTTIRETYTTGSLPPNITNDIKKGYAINSNDKARETIRQTTSINKNEGVVTNNIKSNYIRDLNDRARKTIKQTTIFNKDNTAMQPEVMGTYARDNKDIARKTVKETTIFKKNNTAMQPEIMGTYARDNKDIARKTVKQTTIINKNEGNVTNNIKAPYSKNSNDTAKTTVKQTTIHSTPHMNVGNMENIQYARSKNLHAKPTIKQTTIHSTPHMNVSNMENIQYAKSKDMNAKTTIKQTTIHSTPHMNLGSINDGSYNRNKGEEAKPTIKQTTIHSTPHMNVGSINDGSYMKGKDDIARTTIKETTHLTNYTGGLNAEIEQPRDRTDVNNMCVDDRKEILTYNRTTGGKYDGPHIVDKKTYELKEQINVEREYLNKHKPVDRNIIDEDLNAIYSRNKDKVKKIENEYRINYDYISELDNNPYVNDLMHQKQ